MKKALIFLLFAALGGKICAQEASSSYNVLRLPASSHAAALGGEKVVKTVDGPVELNIKPGTQSDTKVRLRGKGVPALGSPLRGDQYVTLVVNIPTSMNRTQKDALKKFASTMGEEF